MTCRMNGRLPSAALRLYPDGEPTTATGRSPDFADHRQGELPSRFPSGVWLTQLPAHSYGHSAGFSPASLFTRTLPGTCCVTGRVMRISQRGKRQGFGLRSPPRRRGSRAADTLRDPRLRGDARKRSFSQRLFSRWPPSTTSVDPVMKLPASDASSSSGPASSLMSPIRRIAIRRIICRPCSLSRNSSLISVLK